MWSWLGYRRAWRRRRALVMTETELKLMAAAAIIGFRSKPNTGYSTPPQRVRPGRYR